MIKLKFVLLGDMAVGKTSFMIRYSKDRFFNYLEGTIGAAFSSKLLEKNDKRIKIEFWDTAGQERYKSLVSMYYNNADAALIFYDINKIDTLNSAINLINMLKNNGPINIKYILIGNKYDMVDQDSITLNTVNDKLNKSGNSDVNHIYTSAKIDYNIEYSISTLLDLINLENKLEIKEKNITKLDTFDNYRTCCY
jgi:Ras-related protein Rab-5C